MRKSSKICHSYIDFTIEKLSFSCLKKPHPIHVWHLVSWSYSIQFHFLLLCYWIELFLTWNEKKNLLFSCSSWLVWCLFVIWAWEAHVFWSTFGGIFKAAYFGILFVFLYMYKSQTVLRRCIGDTQRVRFEFIEESKIQNWYSIHLCWTNTRPILTKWAFLEHFWGIFGPL